MNAKDGEHLPFSACPPFMPSSSETPAPAAAAWHQEGWMGEPTGQECPDDIFNIARHKRNKFDAGSGNEV
jgi:hypothetical protein